MWVIYAFGSALFAGLTSILAKCGIKKTDSNVATAIRTIVVLIFSWILVFVVGAQGQITDVSVKTWVFLVMSGAATGASWLCYFRALQIGDVNKVVPIDKSGTILTIILAFIFFKEEISPVKFVCVVFIAIGTYMMITKKENSGKNRDKSQRSHSYLFYAVLSAVFASFTSILGKMGMEQINSNLGTAIRTIVVLIMAWIVVFVTGKQNTLKQIEKKELFFICFSGLATGGSWLCYYNALQDGPASVVVPIDKLSIVETIVFSYIVFKEKLTMKSFVGLILIIAGTLLMLV